MLFFPCLNVPPQECIFDKSKGTVSLMNARFLEKFVLGYRRKSKFLHPKQETVRQALFVVIFVSIQLRLALAPESGLNLATFRW